MKMKETLRGPGGMMILLDASEIVPDDPGQGTPAIVQLPFGRGTSTFWCANETGEVDDIRITPRQQRWLDSCENTVNQWVDIRSAAIKRHGREAVLALGKKGGAA